MQLTTRAFAVAKPSGDGHESCVPPHVKSALGYPETQDDEQVNPGPKKIGSEESQPRVRLESSFKF